MLLMKLPILENQRFKVTSNTGSYFNKQHICTSSEIFLFCLIITLPTVSKVLVRTRTLNQDIYLLSRKQQGKGNPLNCWHQYHPQFRVTSGEKKNKEGKVMDRLFLFSEYFTLEPQGPTSQISFSTYY